MRAEKSGEERRRAKGVKHLLADRFPNLAYHYLNVRTHYRQIVHIRRFINFLNREHPEICVSLLDVGARGGLSAIPIFKPLKRLNNRLIHGIEPDTKEAERLRKSGEYDHVFTDGVAWYDGEAVLHVPVDHYGAASIRETDPNVEQPIGVLRQNCRNIPICVKKLSSILPTRATYDFIKTDVEGCDYDVLASAEPALLEKVLCVVCEAQRTPIFKGQHVTVDLHSFLTERQFLLYSLNLQGNLVNQDVIYVKHPGTISDLPTLLKYLLLGLLLKHRGDFISCTLKLYEHNYGKQKALDTLYEIVGEKRRM